MNLWSLLLPFKWFIIGVGEVFGGIVSLIKGIASLFRSLFKYLIEGIIVVCQGVGLVFSDFIFKYLFIAISWVLSKIAFLMLLLLRTLKTIIVSIFKGICFVLSNAFKGLVAVLELILLGLKRILQYLTKAISFIIKYTFLGLKYVIVYFYQAIVWILTYLIKGIKYFFVYLYKFIALIFKYLFIAVKTVLIYIGKGIKFFFVNIIYKYLGVVINAILKALLEVVKFIGRIPLYIWKGIKAAGIQTGKATKAAGAQIGKAIKAAASAVGKAIAYPFVYIRDNFGRIIGETLDKTKTQLKAGFDFVVGVPVKIKNKAVDWFNNLSFIKDIRNRREMKRQALLIDFDAEDSARSDKEVTYRYVAKNTDGKIEKGHLAAFSKLDVHSYLLAEGYEVYEIEPMKGLNVNIGGRPHKIGMSELVFFLTQLSTYIKSGIPLVESIKILGKQTRKKNTKLLYKALVYDLTMGDSFSEALEKQGSSFPKLLVNMVKSSELAGNLSETLDDMSEYYATVSATRKEMKSAMTYPTVIMIFAISVVVFILVYVIPAFVDMYKDAEAQVPAITTIVINLSDFLSHNVIWLILGIVAVVTGLYFMYKNVKVFRMLVQWMAMHTPIIGKIIIYNEVTMFAKTFASLWNHNVFITSSMEILSKITDNEIYKMLIFDAITNVARGEPVSVSFKNHWAFPVVAYEMLVTGERTGQPGPMMDKVAAFYQEEHRNAVNQVKAFIEPVLIIFLAVVVGTILLSVVIPMFSIYGQLGLDKA